MRPVLSLALASVLLAPFGPAFAAEPSELTERSRALSDRFQSQLLAQLTDAMKAGGPTAAIEVCASAAPAIASKLSEESGAVIGRTALRVRNPNAAPTSAEMAQLDAMAKAPLTSDGKPVEVTWTAPANDEQPGFHYMRAIPLKEPCAVCHGSTIAPDVAAAIQAHYPKDQATGFKPGELRGAFRVWWPSKS